MQKTECSVLSQSILPLDPALSQMWSTPSTIFFHNHFNITPNLRLGLPNALTANNIPKHSVLPDPKYWVANGATALHWSTTFRRPTVSARLIFLQRVDPQWFHFTTVACVLTRTFIIHYTAQTTELPAAGSSKHKRSNMIWKKRVCDDQYHQPANGPLKSTRREVVEGKEQRGSSAAGCLITATRSPREQMQLKLRSDTGPPILKGGHTKRGDV
jgi:hypothetical protein